MTGIAIDSRAVEPGNLFVAMQGGSVDGHDYIPKAIDKGAVAVAGQKDLDDLPVPYIRLEDSRRALTYLAVLYHRRGDVKQVEIYVPRCLEASHRSQMIEYIGTAYANLAWANWKKGEFGNFEANFKIAQGDWERAGKGHASGSFQFIILFPAISVALLQEDLPRAIEYARRLLDPLQKRLEDDLTDSLSRAVKAADEARLREAQSHLQEAIKLAEQYHYL